MTLGTSLFRARRTAERPVHTGFSPEAVGLWFWLPMDLGEGAGPPAERAIGNVLGTLNSVPVWEPAPHGGTALLFDGTDDYLEFSSSASTRIETDMTLAFRIRPVNVAEVVVGCEKGNDATSNVAYGFGWNSDGLLAAIQKNTFVATSTCAMVANTWQHVVMRRDAAARTWNYIVDGVDRGSASYVAGNDPVANGESLTFATRGSGGARDFHLQGHLADIGIWVLRLPDPVALNLHTPQAAARLRGSRHRRFARIPDADPNAIVPPWRTQATLASIEPASEYVW